MLPNTVATESITPRDSVPACVKVMHADVTAERVGVVQAGRVALPAPGFDDSPPVSLPSEVDRRQGNRPHHGGGGAGTAQAIEQRLTVGADGVESRVCVHSTTSLTRPVPTNRIYC